MKFKDVAIGDQVFILKSVTYGWHREKKFAVPVLVTKVTPKSFYIGENMYRKEDGSLVRAGASWYSSAFYWGDPHPYAAGKTIEDESKDFNDFRTLIAAIYTITDIASKLTIEQCQNHYDDVIKVKNLLLKIKD